MDHFLGKLNKTLDLSFVREEVSKSYGRNGNVSVDPVVIMKMMLLLFLDNVSSERELMRVVPLRIDYLWRSLNGATCAWTARSRS